MSVPVKELVSCARELQYFHFYEICLDVGRTTEKLEQVIGVVNEKEKRAFQMWDRDYRIEVLNTLERM